jgi:hypothetical protein
VVLPHAMAHNPPAALAAMSRIATAIRGLMLPPVARCRWRNWDLTAPTSMIGDCSATETSSRMASATAPS